MFSKEGWHIQCGNFTSKPKKVSQSQLASSKIAELCTLFIISTLLIFLAQNMAEENELAHMPSCWSLDTKEHHLTKWEVDIFGPFLSINDLDSLKSHLLEEFKLGHDKFHLCKIRLVHLYFPQVYHLPEFVNWFALKYFEIGDNSYRVMSQGFYEKLILIRLNKFSKFLC